MPTFISTLQLCFILDVAKVWFESQEGNLLHFVFNYFTQYNAKAAFPEIVVACFASFTLAKLQSWKWEVISSHSHAEK